MGKESRRHVANQTHKTYDNDRDKYSRKPPTAQPLPASTLFWTLYFGFFISLLVYLLTPAAISVKTPLQIAAMRHSCQDAASLLLQISPFMAVPDATTLSIDRQAMSIVGDMGVTPAPLHYGGILGGFLAGQEYRKTVCVLGNNFFHYLLTFFTSLASFRLGAQSPVGLPMCGFPNAVCISANDVVCHGIPNEGEVMRHGDIVNVDVTTISAEGWHGDTSKMWMIGYDDLHLERYDIHDEENKRGDPFYNKARLAAVTRDALFLGISVVKPGVKLSTIGRTIHEYAEKQGYSVVREYSGHGIGTAFHEGPRVLHYDDKSSVVLRDGMTLTIEPMLNEFGAEIVTDRDQWTVRTRDGGMSAQWEHTVLVTSDGFEILTLRDGEEWPERVLEMLQQGDNIDQKVV
jgi:methionyl aminopeptidase